MFCWTCAMPIALTPQGQTVQVADENIVRPCQYLGDVTGNGVDNASARNDARNSAVTLGATHVVFVSEAPAVITGSEAPNTLAEAMARTYRCAGPAVSPSGQ
jgi:hypothetical protein